MVDLLDLYDSRHKRSDKKRWIVLISHGWKRLSANQNREPEWTVVYTVYIFTKIRTIASFSICCSTNTSFQQHISVDVSLTVVEIVETLFVPLASVRDLLDVEVSPSVTAENRSLWWARSGLQTKAETNPFILCNFRYFRILCNWYFTFNTSTWLTVVRLQRIKGSPYFWNKTYHGHLV